MDFSIWFWFWIYCMYTISNYDYYTYFCMPDSRFPITLKMDLKHVYSFICFHMYVCFVDELTVNDNIQILDVFPFK